MSEYLEKLRDPRWQRKRLEVFQREGFKCESCKAEDRTLHVHHLIYSPGEPWEAPDDTLECLCEDCHERREAFNALFGRGRMKTQKCLVFLDAFSDAFNDECPEALNYSTFKELTRIICEHRTKLFKLQHSQ